ncbi:piezo-type mechanosensitive ion channel component 2 [Plakobranchus ocellatus]|uniref:Piezo-type mechanosensitive ion channel component 2 n=1 Tax=Plakobranchus ocellatus TaxID=259542 RepID=A0AAV4CCY8_9GAST|nr:piezo-type mechanosensitive ion channel component 2 [Plakobranchus ocellatus]
MVARGRKFLNFVLFRIVLPLVLLIAAFLRFNAISLIYLLCLLATPLLRIPSRISMQAEANGGTVDSEPALRSAETPVAGSSLATGTLA